MVQNNFINKNNFINRRALKFVVQATIIVAVFFVSGGDVSAQTAVCGVGTRVVFEDGTRGVGTILEIGTEHPHIGWYRIGLSWQPKGEWYPKNFGILTEDTKAKCVQEADSKKQPPNTASKSSSAKNTDTALPEINGCPFDVPPGKVSSTSPASAGLFKRVIYERAAAKIDPESITAPKRIGLTFLKFEMGAAYKNTLSSSRFGDKRRHDGAPVGAMIYPLKTTELQCDLHGKEVRRSVKEYSRDCFKSKDGVWVCPGSATKTIESKLIPAN
jgi:hypothetical protein